MNNRTRDDAVVHDFAKGMMGRIVHPRHQGAYDYIRTLGRSTYWNADHLITTIEIYLLNVSGNALSCSQQHVNKAASGTKYK